MGATQEWDGVLFRLGPANAPDVVTGETVTLPIGKFSALKILATGVEGSQKSQTFTVAYTDGTSSTFTQSLSDWYSPGSFGGESMALTVPYRLAGDGETDDGTFHIFGYSFDLDGSRVVRSVALPRNRKVTQHRTQKHCNLILLREDSFTLEIRRARTSASRRRVRRSSWSS